MPLVSQKTWLAILIGVAVFTLIYNRSAKVRTALGAGA